MLKRIFAFCLLILLSGHSFGQNNSAETEYDTLLTACIEQQFAEETSPSLNKELNLLDVCPDLSILLATRENKDFIQPTLHSDTSLNRLLDERALRQRPYRTPTSISTDLALVNLLGKQYSFNARHTEAPGLWQRFKQWLKDNYGTQDEDTNIDWLLELLDGFSVPDWLYKTILYGSIALVIIMAIVIVANEFRHYKRYKDRDNNLSDDDTLSDIHSLRKLSWDEVQALPLQQKTSALLQYLIQQCIDRQWLPNNNSFTNREFYQRLKKLDADKASQFNQVVNAAEQAIYGKHPLSADELKKIMFTTESILKNDELASS